MQPTGGDMSHDPDEFDNPEDFASAVQEALGDPSGTRKLCMRAIQCVRKLTCEHAQTRQGTVELQDLFNGRAPDLGDCENWSPRRELNTGLDIPRRKSGGISRHNAHANRIRAQEELLRKIEAGEPLPYSTQSPEELKKMLYESRARRKK